MREQRKLKKLKSLIRRLRTRPAFNLQQSTHKSLDDKIEQKKNHHKIKTGAKFCAEQCQPEVALKTKM
jgi:hypothetical protein